MIRSDGFDDDSTCPNRKHHDNGQVLVPIGDTILSNEKDPRDGKVRRVEKRTEKLVKYKDWEWRCPACWPRS